MTQVTDSQVLAIVPARFASTRFPGKIIAPLEGKPVVYHTYLRVLEAKLVSRVLIATDDERVVDALRPYDVDVVMTRADHACGTDRIAEVAEKSDASIIVNVQGDEPLIVPQTIDDTIRPLLNEPDVVMSTARHRITDEKRINDPNTVKVVCDQLGHAMYFSRLPIPYIRDGADRIQPYECYWQHVGLYAYRRDFLLRYAAMPQTPIETLEKLEQMRVLENGYTIAVVNTEYEGLGVDTPEDLEEVKTILAAMQKDK